MSQSCLIPIDTFRNAIKIIGADSASIHVTQPRHPLHRPFLLEAGTGKATKEFLRDHPPRDKGIGRQALDIGQYVVYDKPEDLVKEYPTIYKEGVRAIAAFPLFIGTDVQGLLYIHFWRNHQFSKAELELESVFARQIEIIIQNYLHLRQVRQDLERRDKELEALQVIDRAIVTGAHNPDRWHVFELILKTALEISRAPVGHIFWYNHDNVLELYADERGVYKEPAARQVNKLEGIVGLAAKRGESVLVHNVHLEEWSQIYQGIVSETQSEIAVPLKDGNNLLGVLHLENSEVSAFTENDKALLETLAVLAVIAIHSVDLYQKLERQIKPWRALSVIAARIQDPKYDDLDTILRLILIGVTAGEGAAFSRAILLLVDENKTKLQGKMAIGALKNEEANNTWQRLEYEAVELRANDQDVLASLLNQGEGFSNIIKKEKSFDYPLSLAIQTISIPLDTCTGVLASCMKGNAEIIKDSQDDPFRDHLAEATGTGDRGLAFVFAPLKGKRKTPIGILVADNRFLSNEREIDDFSKNTLEAFASVAAISIEMLEAREQKVAAEKLAIINSLASLFAHRMPNVIGTIPLAVREIRNTWNPSDKGIQNWLNRLETDAIDLLLMAEQLRGSAEAGKGSVEALSPEPIDLYALLSLIDEKMSHEHRSLIVDLKGVSPQLPQALGIRKQLLEVCFNLARNAEEASLSKPGYLTIHAQLAEDEGFIEVRFSDAGRGISSEYHTRIFDLGFTTKSQQGLGLGLWWCKTVLCSQGGDIRLESSQPGQGTTFIVRMPIAQSDY